MASERQIAANRRNAHTSTGPRSSGGKNRASRNSYRHGLTARPLASANLAKAIERLARKLAADSTNAVTLEQARTAAQAAFDLARIRQVKVAVIERMLAAGAHGAPQADRIVSDPHGAEANTPSQEPELLAEAVQRAIPELIKLERYERRTSALRDRALRTLQDVDTMRHVLSLCLGKTKPIL
jgi:hypothetical protein